MAENWEQNGERRPEPAGHRAIDDEPAVETAADGPREALEEFGEDVASSPARRGHDNRTDTDTDVDEAEEATDEGS